ncbi:GNAT family N-acetyltransferase [Flaviaesturariibacter terrae]
MALTDPAGTVTLVDYSPAYAAAFRALNEAWISTYFRMEEADHKALEHPEEKILDPGGAIVVALLDGEPVGVCALIRHADGSWELAKMAVSPEAQGHGIGFLLGLRILDIARARGARSVFLESNTILKPAMALYPKLGFREVPHLPSPYQRSNIRMEVSLAPASE